MLNLKGLFTRERLTNRGTWTAVISFVLMVLLQGGVIDTNMGEQVDTFLKALLTFLTFLGFLNNPSTENKGFGDDK